MKTVGVRELKNRLSEYIRQVRAGEGVLVTDRGEVVAELTAPGRASVDTSVPAGAAKGRLTHSNAVARRAVGSSSSECLFLENHSSSRRVADRLIR